MKKYEMVVFLARMHGLNALEALLKDDRFIIKNIFTHKKEPKSIDPLQKERKEFKLYKNIAIKHNIELITIDTKKEESLINLSLKKMGNIDFLISVSWRLIFSKDQLKRINIASINIHRGDLPKYPGANPIAQALKMNEAYGYITSHYMIPKVDAGKVINKIKYPLQFNRKFSFVLNIERIKSEITHLFGPLVINSLNKVLRENLNE